MGDRDGDLSRTELTDRLVDIGKQGGDKSGRRYQLLNGIGDKRQRATGQSVTNELGRYVENSVAEPAISSRCAVVRFIRMQDVELTRQADAAQAAVVKRLHAGCRNADGVGVVPMRVDLACGEVDVCAFDPVRTRSESDRGRPRGAGLFKTAGIDTS